jgi:acylpyruvate hydrolase
MKIICIGRNYVAHARELNNDVPAEPVFFMKPDTSLLLKNRPFHVPEWSKDVHYEIELVVRICRTGTNIFPESAHLHYQEIGLGIDFTARDVQDQLKSKGLPWEKAKAFDKAAVLGTGFIRKDSFHGMDSIRFRLDLNGKTVQEGNSGLMIFSFEAIIAHVSKYVTLKKGDLIYTGTPAGVGPVRTDDHLEGYLEDEKLLDFWVK